MFKKSMKSAFLMASFFVIPTVTIAIVMGQIRYYLLPPAERNPNVSNGFSGIIAGMIAFGILLLSIGMAASIIYFLNETHYGRQGAVRWAAAGTIYGILQQLVLTPIPSEFDFGLLSIAMQIGKDILWKSGTLILCYFLMFPLLTWLLKRKNKEHRVIR